VGQRNTPSAAHIQSKALDADSLKECAQFLGRIFFVYSQARRLYFLAMNINGIEIATIEEVLEAAGITQPKRDMTVFDEPGCEDVYQTNPLTGEELFQ
jgi:hypothetical protein